MSWWLQGAIEEIGCEGEGCSFCPYQIYKHEETWACVADKAWKGYGFATELWYILGKQEKGKKLIEIIDNAERDKEDTPLLSLADIEKAIPLFAGLDKALYEFTGNIHYRFDPIEKDWILKKYSRLVTHWKNPDGTDVYTLVNSLTDAEATEYYLRGALRVGKPILLD